MSTIDLSPYEIDIGDTRELVTKLNSALTALQSSMNAVGLGVINLKGFHDASTGAYPAGPAQNDAWVIDTAGTISTVDYEVGDLIGYDGTDWITLFRRFVPHSPGEIGGTTPGAFTGTTVQANTKVVTDQIDEKTAGAGVTIDGVLLKDGSLEGTNGSFTGTMEVGSLTVNGGATVSTGSSGAAAAAQANDFVIEGGSGDAVRGMSILTPDGVFSQLALGSPSEPRGVRLSWKYNDGTLALNTAKVGASISFGPDNGVTNLTLSGESGSQLTAAAGRVSCGAGKEYTQNNGADAVSTYRQSASTSLAALAIYSDNTSTRTLHCRVMCDGDLENTNNSYGSLSDIKIKVEDSIEPSTSQIGDVMKLARIMSKFNLKADPAGFKQLGWIAQQVREISPGLVKESPDMELVEVEKTRQVERQKTRMVEKPVAKQDIEIVDGKAVLRQWYEIEPVEELVFEEYPLEDAAGEPRIVKVKATAALYDREGNVIQEAQEERIEQAVHRVPVMETVEETYTEKEERQIILPDGTPSVTLSLKHSVAHLKAFKALGELFDMIKDADGLDDLKAQITTALES